MIAPLRRQPCPRLVRTLLLVLAVLPAAATGAEETEEGAARDPVFAVDRFEIGYVEPHPDLPAPSELLPLEVPLSRTATGWVAPREGSEVERVIVGGGSAGGDYHASAIAAVSTALLERVRDEGLIGVFVSPHPADIDVRNELDLRTPGDRRLRMQILVGRVRELRSVAVGDRIRDGWRVNNPAHRAIRRGSPIQPADLVREGTTDIVRADVLEDYLFRLNRHPGRRVEAALAAAQDGDGIALDLRVQEARPWFVYAQTSNTGTPRTAVWQQRYGLVHRQLTGRDDILALHYTNAGLDKVHAFQASYEAPWFSPRRPDWLRSGPDDPIWLRYPGRDNIPWWGVDRLRWRFDGSYSSFEASNVAGTDDIVSTEWQGASRLVYEVFQLGNLFVDVFAGTRARGVTVDNEAFNEGSEFFFLPEVGLELERIQEISTFHARLSYEKNVAGTARHQLEQLGRPRVDGSYGILRYDVGTTQYLEPLLFPEAWEDPSTPNTSTLVHEVAVGFRGQYAFDYRLIPQASQVIGGIYSVRGYDPSISVGDSVWVASAEYRFHLPRLLPIRREALDVPVIGPFRAAPQQVYGRPDWDFVIRGFVDAGRTIRNPLSNGTRQPGERNDTLLGVGVGAEFRFRHNLTARVDWGYPLRAAGCSADGSVCRTERGDDELHFLFSIVY